MASPVMLNAGSSTWLDPCPAVVGTAGRATACPLFSSGVPASLLFFPTVSIEQFRGLGI